MKTPTAEIPHKLSRLILLCTANVQPSVSI